MTCMWIFSSKAREARQQRKLAELKELALAEERRIDMLYITGGSATPGTIPFDPAPVGYKA